jgi:hypothetical protein
MAGTWWIWKQSVSETRVDTRVRKRHEFPGLGKACLATEDMAEGVRRFEEKNKGARFGLGWISPQVQRRGGSLDRDRTEEIKQCSLFPQNSNAQAP